MPKWKKSSPEVIARFAAALPRDPRVNPRTMFGYPAAFVAGGFFTGLHEERVVLRLPSDVHAATKVMAGAQPFDPMGGRPMKGWYIIPPAISGDVEKLGTLLLHVLGKIADHPEQLSAAKRKAMKSTTMKSIVKKPPAKKPPAKK